MSNFQNVIDNLQTPTSAALLNQLQSTEWAYFEKFRLDQISCNSVENI